MLKENESRPRPATRLRSCAFTYGYYEQMKIDRAPHGNYAYTILLLLRKEFACYACIVLRNFDAVLYACKRFSACR